MPVNERAHTIGLVGAKGGVGTTVLTSSLAWALAQRGLQVLVIDLDRRGGQAAVHLCERNAGPTVREALHVIQRLDATLLDTLLTPCGPHLRLLPSPRAWMDAAFEPPFDGDALYRLVHTAGELADCVLLDLPPSALQDEAGQRLLQAVDEAALISEPTLPATFNARRAWQHLRELRADVVEPLMPGTRFVLNKVQGFQALPADQVRRTLGLDGAPLTWRELPRADALVAQATYEGKPVGALDPRHALSRAMSQWAAQLADRCGNRTAAPSSAPQSSPVAAERAGAEEATRRAPAPGSWRERLQRWAS